MTALLGGLKYSWLDMQKTRKDRKSHRLSVKGRAMAIFAPMVSKKPGIGA